MCLKFMYKPIRNYIKKTVGTTKTIFKSIKGQAFPMLSYRQGSKLRKHAVHSLVWIFSCGDDTAPLGTGPRRIKAPPGIVWEKNSSYHVVLYLTTTLKSPNIFCYFPLLLFSYRLSCSCIYHHMFVGLSCAFWYFPRCSWIFVHVLALLMFSYISLHFLIMFLYVHYCSCMSLNILICSHIVPNTFLYVRVSAYVSCNVLVLLTCSQFIGLAAHRKCPCHISQPLRLELAGPQLRCLRQGCMQLVVRLDLGGLFGSSKGCQRDLQEDLNKDKKKHRS